jgi:hypothetical protein
MKRMFLFVLLFLTLLIGTGCLSEADVASENVSKEADAFRVMRRIVFINGITDEYLLVIEGYCSLGNFDGPKELSVTCKTGEGQYMKHFLGLSDNVTYISEQLAPIGVSGYHYTVRFRPETLIPNIDLDTSSSTTP